MKVANRLKMFGTGTTAASITLTTSPLKSRTLAQAISAKKINLSQTCVPFWVEDSSGNWEVGEYTITSGTVITQTTRFDSSNNGNAVTFDGGTLTVSNDMLAYYINNGVVNPDEVGYDIIVCAGQSNMCGRGTYDAMIDTPNDRILQWGCLNSGASAARYQTIFSGQEPLHWPEGLNNNTGTSLTSPANAFARAYLRTVSSNRMVLLVPVAWGGTSLYAGTPRWGVGGDLRENAIAQANAALAAAQVDYPSSKITHILWHQGESDVASGVNTSQYSAALSALITDFRTRMNGASDSIFLIGGMIQEYISQYSSGPGIDTAHKNVAAATSKCLFVAAPYDSVNHKYSLDNTHLNALGERRLGISLALASKAASFVTGVDTIAPTVASAIVSASAPTLLDVTFSEAMDTSSTPAASAFTVTNHTVASVQWISSTVLRITLSNAYVYNESTTLAYIKPSSNYLRDLATTPNATVSFSGQVITDGVPQPADALQLTVSPTSSTIGTQVTVTVTANRTLTGSQSITVTLAAPVAGNWGTGSVVTLNASTQSVQQSFTSTATGSGNFTATATGGNLTVSSATAAATINASATVPGAPTGVTATAGDGTIVTSFSAPASDGGSSITGYIVDIYRASDDAHLGAASGTSSPITATSSNGVANGTASYVTVSATNGVGEGAASAHSSTVTPLAEVVTVDTVAAQTSGTAFNVTGTFANGTPTALDWSKDGGTNWTAAVSPTINTTNHTYSFSVTISSVNATQTIKVRDHTNQNAIGTSNSFAVNAPPPSLTTLGNMAATSTAGNYQGDSGAAFWGSEAYGVLNVAFQANTDGEFIVQMIDVPSHTANTGREIGIGVDTVVRNTTSNRFGNQPFFFMHRSDGCLTYINGGNGGVDVSGYAAQQNDLVRCKRINSSTGTPSLIFSVQRSGSSTWTDIKTFSSGVSAGVMYCHVNLIYLTTVKLVSTSNLA